MLQKSKFLNAGLSAFILVVSSLKAEAQAINYSDCPTCNSSQISVHTEIRDKYLGVWGNNPSVPSTYGLRGINKFVDFYYWDIVPTEPVDIFIKTFNMKNWLPLRTLKQNFVGKIENFKVSHMGNENDWNIHLAPAYGFESFLNDALAVSFKNTNEWFEQKSSLGKYTIEAEMTPVKSAFDNPWFNNIKDRTILMDKQIGVYGAFVGEGIHGFRPEIHPSEIIWWKESENSTVILLAADASDRFDDMSDFSTELADPGEKKPWTQDIGQEAELKIPFEIDPSSGSLIYNLYSLYGNDSFYKGANYADISNGASHTITYKGSEVLTVVESSFVQRYVGVTFTDVCYDSQRSLLKGYIVLKTAIGNGDGGKEGFVTLQLDKTKYAINEKPGLVIGDVVNTADNWTTFNSQYDSSVPFTNNDIISSDKFGRGLVDGLIDFNGNGITDLFSVQGGRWMVLYEGKGQWKQINSAGESLNDLRFGDINGDKITDVLTVNGQNKVMVSYNGTGAWTVITDSGEQTKDIRVGDFNGDNKTDIVYMKFTGMKGLDILSEIGLYDLYVKYSCTGSWIKLNYDFNIYNPSKKANWDNYNRFFRFGNFNGDNITDLFRYHENKFMVYWGGKDDMKELCKPLVNDYDMSKFLFVDNLSRTGYTDVIYVKESIGVWKFYYEGKIITSGRNMKYYNPFAVSFGNFNSDAKWEPITVAPVKQNTIPTNLLTSFDRIITTDPFVLPKYEKGSLKKVLVDGKPALTVNLSLEYNNGTNGSKLNKFNFQKVSQITQKNNAKIFQYTPITSSIVETPTLGIIKDIPLGKKASDISVKFLEFSTPVEFEIHPYGIDAVPHDQILTSDIGGNWNNWKTFLSPKIKPQYASLMTSSPGIVEKVKKIQFEFLPYYSSIEDGKVSIIEMDDMMRELNAIVYSGDATKINEIFANKDPFIFRWSFELKNTVTGAIIPIDKSNVISTNGKLRNNKLIYTFPEQNELLEFKATVNIEDRLGNISAPIEIKFYNQRIKFNNAKVELTKWLDKISTESGKSFPRLNEDANELAIDNFFTIDDIINLLK